MCVFLSQTASDRLTEQWKLECVFFPSGFRSKANSAPHFTNTRAHTHTHTHTYIWHINRKIDSKTCSLLHLTSVKLKLSGSDRWESFIYRGHTEQHGFWPDLMLAGDSHLTSMGPRATVGQPHRGLSRHSRAHTYTHAHKHNHHEVWKACCDFCRIVDLVHVCATVWREEHVH